jgi:lipoate-protein ligase A
MAHQTLTARQWEVRIDPAGRSGAENMAVDQSLLDDAARSGTATLRLYRWDPPCLSFGRNDAAAALYDRAKMEQLGIDVVRRPTGGSAVWHEHEVTYAVAAPIEMFGSLRQAYHTIHERLAAALRSLGAGVTLAPTRLPALQPSRRSACFGSAVGGEILAGGRKLVGSAQLRKGGAFLQHGSILLAGSQEMIQAVSLQQSAVSHQVSDVRGAATLSQALGREVAFDEVANAVIAAFSDRLTAASSDRLTAALSFDRLTAALRDPTWTWRR